MKKVKAKDELGIDHPDEFTASTLSFLDSTLRCPICSELFVGPVLLTSCSHTFCSKCLRESMLQKKACPQCFAEADEGRIRKNSHVETIAQAWQNARPALLALQSAQLPTPSTFKRLLPSSSSTLKPNPSSDSDAYSDNEAPAPSRSYATRSSKITEGKERNKTVVGRMQPKGGDAMKGKGKKEEMEEEIAGSSDIEIVEVRSSTKGLGKKAKKQDPNDPNLVVECPICNASVRNLELNKHIDDNCPEVKPRTGGGGKDAWGKLMGGSAVKTKEKDKRGSSQPSKSDSSTTKPIALVSYSGMKAQSLKKLLEEQNLPTTVPSTATTASEKVAFYKRRHQQWTTLWNANCDVDIDDPRRLTPSGLRKELQKWEDIMDGEVVNRVESSKAYSKAHDGEFRELIKAVKAADLVKKKAREHKVDTPTEEEDPRILVEDAPNEEEDADEEDSDKPMVDFTSVIAPATFAPDSDDEDVPLALPTTSPPTITHNGGLSSSPSPPLLPLSFSLNLNLDFDPPDLILPRKRSRSYSPYDPAGPRPSQRIREEVVYDPEEAEDSFEGGRVGGTMAGIEEEGEESE